MSFILLLHSKYLIGDYYEKEYYFRNLFTFVLNYCFPYSKYHDMEETSRVRYSCHDIPGYVYFEGFDFEGYSAESAGIEPMLSKTLDLLNYYYGVKK